MLAESFAALARRGLLALDDAERAAYLFVYLAVSIPLNRASFLGDSATYTPDELDDLAGEAVRVFLAAYTAIANSGSGNRHRGH